MTKIEWTDETWNPVTGCTPISEGCKNCYAKRMARRLAGRAGYPHAPRHFDVTVHWDRLRQPRRWKKPRRVFVCSMGDLFHEDVPFVYPVLWECMDKNPRHTFQILTKRGRNMHVALTGPIMKTFRTLPNVWLGVTAENQAAADSRIPWLLRTPAAVRFVSVEPILGPVNLSPYLDRLEGSLDWVIVGGETGPGARPADPEWVHGVLGQCITADVPFFFKGWGDWCPHLQGGKPTHTRIPNNPQKRVLMGRTWDQFPTSD